MPGFTANDMRRMFDMPPARQGHTMQFTTRKGRTVLELTAAGVTHLFYLAGQEPDGASDARDLPGDEQDVVFGGEDGVRLTDRRGVLKHRRRGLHRIMHEFGNAFLKGSHWPNTTSCAQAVYGRAFFSRGGDV
jgi:hypothetical protein